MNSYSLAVAKVCQVIFDVLTNVEAITSKEIYKLFTSKRKNKFTMYIKICNVG